MARQLNKYTSPEVQNECLQLKGSEPEWANRHRLKFIEIHCNQFSLAFDKICCCVKY